MASIPYENRRGLTQYVRYALWYLKRPQLYPDFVRQVGRVLRRERAVAGERVEAERWCRERAVEWTDALDQMTGVSTPRPSVRDRFKETLDLAEANARQCPVQMGGPGSMDLIYWTAEWLQATRVIETGVAYGWSSLAILLSLRDRDGAKLISTDRPYLDRDNDPYVGCVVPDELRSLWQILRQADREALPKALAQMPSIDLCHYDSDKSVAGRRWAYPRLWKALHPGGCFLSDDISDNLGFRDFCLQVGVEPIVVRVPDPNLDRAKHVGVLIKPPVSAPATA